MPDYTHISIEDVADSGPQGLEEIRFATAQIETEQVGFTHHRWQPGAQTGFAHRHDEAEEVYFVIAGSGRVKLDDEVLELSKGDALRLAPPVIRSFAAGPEGLEILAFGARHDNDGEAFENWWPAE